MLARINSGVHEQISLFFSRGTQWGILFINYLSVSKSAAFWAELRIVQDSSNCATFLMTSPRNTLQRNYTFWNFLHFTRRTHSFTVRRTSRNEEEQQNDLTRTKTNVTCSSLGQAIWYSCCVVCCVQDLVLKTNRLWAPSLVGDPSGVALIGPWRTLRATRIPGLFISVKQDFLFNSTAERNLSSI